VVNLAAESFEKAERVNTAGRLWTYRNKTTPCFAGCYPPKNMALLTVQVVKGTEAGPIFYEINHERDGR